MTQTSYAMVWWFDDSPRNMGRVEVEDGAVVLVPTTAFGRTERIRFVDVARAVLDRGELRVERRDRSGVRIGSLDAPGTLRELAELLADAA